MALISYLLSSYLTVGSQNWPSTSSGTQEVSLKAIFLWSLSEGSEVEKAGVGWTPGSPLKAPHLSTLARWQEPGSSYKDQMQGLGLPVRGAPQVWVLLGQAFFPGPNPDIYHSCLLWSSRVGSQATGITKIQLNLWFLDFSQRNFSGDVVQRRKVPHFHVDHKILRCQQSLDWCYFEIIDLCDIS